MAVGMDVDHGEAELLGIVAAVFRRRLDAEHFRIVLPHEGGGGHDIEFGAVQPVIEDVVHVPSEYRFHTMGAEEAEQIRASGLVDIVIGAGLVGAQQEQGIVEEDEDAPALGLGERTFKPRPLLRLARQAGIQDRRVEQDEADAVLVEGPPAGAEILLMDVDPALAHPLGRHGAVGLVANVVISRQHMHAVVVLAEHVLHQRHRGIEGRQFGHRMHQVPQMDHELGLVAGDLAGDEARAAGGLLVHLPGRGLVAALGLHMGVAHQGEGEEQGFGRRHRSLGRLGTRRRADARGRPRRRHRVEERDKVKRRGRAARAGRAIRKVSCPFRNARSRRNSPSRTPASASARRCDT